MMILGMIAPASAQIVAIGDRNVAGQGVSSSDAWPAQFEARLHDRQIAIIPTRSGPELREHLRADHIHFTAAGYRPLASHMAGPRPSVSPLTYQRSSS
ncbi:MAG: hypothetical protein QM576_14765 [Rhodopseudomonas sp.]|uniref:hypothetical protein n=1 Tax=Rhodopseudomonas sp. TaxID=1078 RepID=UPI0039E2807E